MNTNTFIEKLSKFTPNEALAMLNLIKIANDEGSNKITASLTTLQNATNFSRPTVIKVLSSLQERGIIDCHRYEAGKQVGSKANTYEINREYII